MKTNSEIWKDIEGYENLYQVSSKGRVKSLARMVKVKEGKYRPVEDRLLKIRENHSTGYYRVTLCKDMNKRTFSIHRLVTISFIPNPNAKEQVNHIDGDKANNSVENLEWNTQHENMRHAFDTGLKSAPLESISVLNPEIGCIYPSIKKAAEMNRMSYARLRGELNGTHKKTTNLVIADFKKLVHVIHYHKHV